MRYINIITALLALIISLPSNAEVIEGQVMAVYDGDSITVLDDQKVEHKIRMMGIDAPERSQPFADASKKALSDLVYRKHVTVDFNKRDRYRRVIGKVILNGADVNLEQVKRGMAWHYKQYQNEQELDDRSLYAQEEYLAQRDRRGLWAGNELVAPWEWRRNK